MTLEEKIGQMIMVWARLRFVNQESPEARQLLDEMKQYHVGGFGVTVPVEGRRLIKSEPLEAAALTNFLQQNSKYPLLFAADFESGVAMRLNGATQFPPAMAFGAVGDPDLARRAGSVTAREARAIGVHWNWAPVADVNSNPANPIINTRSFGEDPASVSRMVSSYIEGARQSGMMATAKHFPGHGDTDTDTHLELARVTGSAARLDSVELVPFRAAVQAGVDAVMIGHMIVPALEPDPRTPASISHAVIADLLQKQIGFQGLVITDALDMTGLMGVFSGSAAEVSGQEAVRAVLAGNDMVIIPADLGGAYNGLLLAAQSGKLSRTRIDLSVRKILSMKASMSLEHHRLVDLSAVTREVGMPESVALAQEVSSRAITLARDDNHLLPLSSASAGGTDKTMIVLLSDDLRMNEGMAAFAKELKQRLPDAEVFAIDSVNLPLQSRSNLERAAARADNVIVVAGTQLKSEGELAGGRAAQASMPESSPIPDMQTLLTELLAKAGDKTVVVAFGDPYVALGMAGIHTYLCTFSTTPQSAESATRALFGEAELRGHLPVTLPGIAERGVGLSTITSPR